MTYRCTKCTSLIHENLGLILDTPLISTTNVYSLIAWYPNNTIKKNLESPFDLQQDPIKIRQLSNRNHF